MQSTTMFALVALSMLLAFVQCSNHKLVSEYEIKEGLLSGGRSYRIKSKTNAPKQYTIQNELFKLGKALTLLENGKPLYTVKHDILNLMSTWTIKEATTDKVLGTMENKLRFVGSKMAFNGLLGHYTIHGNFGNHEYMIEKDGVKVAKIHKKNYRLHDTYDVTVYDDADRALMVLFSVLVDEIRQH